MLAPVPMRVLAAFAAISLLAQLPATPDLILYNGHIVTVDGRFSSVEAVAIKNGAFAAVGKNSEVRAMAAGSTKSIDLQGRTVIPGLMDNHLHSAGGGPGVDLSRARTVADVLHAIAERVRASTAKDVIVVSNSDWRRSRARRARIPSHFSRTHALEDRRKDTGA